MLHSLVCTRRGEVRSDDGAKSIICWNCCDWLPMRMRLHSNPMVASGILRMFVTPAADSDPMAIALSVLSNVACEDASATDFCFRMIEAKRARITAPAMRMNIQLNWTSTAALLLLKILILPRRD